MILYQRVPIFIFFKNLKEKIFRKKKIESIFIIYDDVNVSQNFYENFNDQ